MASKSLAEALKHGSDTRADYYRGTKAELVEAGICDLAWFPKKLSIDTRYDPPRTKRTYPVVNHHPETTLTHRRDAEGRDYWIVRVAVSDMEHAKREKEADDRYAEYISKQKQLHARFSAERQTKAEAAWPWIEQFRERYPNVAVGGELDANQLNVEFEAALDALKGCGLVSSDMMEDCNREPGGWYRGNTPLGDRYFLSPHFGNKGSWRLSLFIGFQPREKKRIEVRDARRLLKAIATRAKQDTGT